MARTEKIDFEKVIDSVEDLTSEEKEDIKKLIKNGNSIEILVTGKTGAGKSSLLNFILGKTIFDVGKTKDAPCTSEVHFKDSERNGIKIRAWDSPGLQDGTGDEKYIKDMQQKCAQIDLMLYCVSMEEMRSDLHVHYTAIHKINKLFGKQYWKNTVFVLTFANFRVTFLKAKGTSEAKLKDGVEERITEWRETIQKTLTSLEVDKKIVDSILVVPAGHPSKSHLPGYRHWISNVWSQCLLRMKSNAQTALIKMETQDGFVKEQDADKIGKVSADERKIVFTPGVKIAMGVALTGIAATGTGIGAAIGGAIGALAIGIPSFGVAAGVGLGLGAAVGGVIGGSIAIGVGALISLYRKRKMSLED